MKAIRKAPRKKTKGGVKRTVKALHNARQGRDVYGRYPDVESAFAALRKSLA